jgi:SAM-dependent methyltransferase
MANAVDFWNDIYVENPIYARTKTDAVMVAAMEHFGSIKGAKVLDLGCGDGSTSIFFAENGAEVTAIDISEVAIQNLNQFCQNNRINSIKPVVCSAFDIDQLGEFDFIFGSMILHHLEPFDQFAAILRKSLASDGKCFFYENNAYSDALVWCRNNLVGKFGIPKYGDEDESPLMPSEVAILRRQFNVETVYPFVQFFQMASVYLFKGKLKSITVPMDNFLYRFESTRQLSYRQYLMLS